MRSQEGGFTSGFWGRIEATLFYCVLHVLGCRRADNSDAQQQWLIIVDAAVECIKIIVEAAIWIWYAYQRTPLKNNPVSDLTITYKEA